VINCYKSVFRSLEEMHECEVVIREKALIKKNSLKETQNTEGCKNPQRHIIAENRK